MNLTTYWKMSLLMIHHYAITTAITVAIAAIRIQHFRPLARGFNRVVKECVNECDEMERMTAAYPDI